MYRTFDLKLLSHLFISTPGPVQPPHKQAHVTMFSGSYAMQVIAIGCEDGCLQLLDTRSGVIEQRVEKAHSSRIRGVAAISALSQNEGAESACVGSASSDGAVKLWDLRSTGNYC